MTHINQIYCETDLSSKDGLTSNIHSFLLSKQYSGFKYHELLIGFNLESTLLFWYRGFPIKKRVNLNIQMQFVMIRESPVFVSLFSFSLMYTRDFL